MLDNFFHGPTVKNDIFIYRYRRFCMTIAGKMETFITKSSWIRKMFEEGARLKQQHGSENVFDFSLGNPYLQPPEKFRTVLQDLVKNAGPCDHSYMPNTGYPAVCKKVADYLVTEQNVPISPVKSS